MTAKANDPVSLPISFEVSNTGAAQTYANAAAFTGAGGAFTWYNAGVALASQPSYTLTPVGVTGMHFLTFNLPLGVDTILITKPSGIRSDPDALVLAIGSADADSIDSKISTAVGTPVASDRVTQYDWEMTEGDSFLKEMQISVSALSDFGYTDLADLPAGAWTIAAAARLSTNPPPAAPTFTMVATVSDKTNRKVKIAIPKGLANATVDYTVGSSRAFSYDVQLQGPIAIPITAVSTGAKKFTVAGDQRLYFTAADTFTITGSTGNNATYTIVSATLVSTTTEIVVVETVPNAVADGTINTNVKLTPIRGTLTIKRQETTTP